LKIIAKTVKADEIWNSRVTEFEEMLKAVADVKRDILAMDAEMHSDLEALLLENGSEQKDLWGFNLYPLKDKTGTDYVEFTSFINIRPSQDNRSMEVMDPEVRSQIISLVHRLLL
jgi:hypothetical protein